MKYIYNKDEILETLKKEAMEVGEVKAYQELLDSVVLYNYNKNELFEMYLILGNLYQFTLGKWNRKNEKEECVDYVREEIITCDDVEILKKVFDYIFEHRNENKNLIYYGYDCKYNKYPL